ncbi:MAG: hypothetical protein COU66_02900 [Candidatus Pacebacteria bacterium CG10_big_fil_rev_8_21_14_0_10_44_11]|nr:MAG: hypothetical protein COU66_02900 [Candidatus Pacebacteria bacterium CG10_big_fil_rev_8_21_14_0_10_44_11]
MASYYTNKFVLQNLHKTLPSTSQKRKIINKYFSNAYAVYDKQKSFHIIALIINEVASKTNYMGNERIIIRKSIFDHFLKHVIDKKTGKIDKKQLFQLVVTLNVPDEIYYSKEGKLRFFRKVRGKIENEVIVNKDLKLLDMSCVLTQFTNNLDNKKDMKYSRRQKNTSIKVFFNSGGAQSLSLI